MPKPIKDETPPRAKAHVSIRISAFIPSLKNPEQGDAIEAEPFTFVIYEGLKFKAPPGLVAAIRKLLGEMAEYAQSHEPKEPEAIIMPETKLIGADGRPLN